LKKDKKAGLFLIIIGSVLFLFAGSSYFLKDQMANNKADTDINNSTAQDIYQIYNNVSVININLMQRPSCNGDNTDETRLKSSPYILTGIKTLVLICDADPLQQYQFIFEELELGILFRENINFRTDINNEIFFDLAQYENIDSIFELTLYKVNPNGSGSSTDLMSVRFIYLNI